jgi:UTP-glucose-1-phosphate uridylyltransferase
MQRRVRSTNFFMMLSPTNPALLVLAAGLGTRYGGLKQMDPVGPAGETVLDYSVYDALRAGFRKVVFVIRKDFAAEFRERVGRRFESRAEVRYVLQEVTRLPGTWKAPAARQKPWGTGHAVWCAGGEIDGPFAVINADDFYSADSFQQLGRFLAKPAAVGTEYCMVGFALANTLSLHGTVSRGVCMADSQGRLLGIEECTAIEAQPSGARQVRADGAVRVFNGGEIVSMNCWGFFPQVFAALERQLCEFLATQGDAPKAEFYLPTAVGAMLVQDGATVRILPTQASWFGVTYQEDRARVSDALARLVLAGNYPAPLWAATGSKI